MTEEIVDPKPEENQDLEEAAFNASVDALVPETPTHPLEMSEEDETKDKSDAEEAVTEEVVDKFLGDLTAEQVLEKLGEIDKLEGIEEAVFEKVSQRVFGKFGEVGQQLKALQEREFSFDPEKLTKLKELDEGMASALAEDLKSAFSGQQFDSETVVSSLRKDVFNELNPYVEQRLLAGFVPDAAEIAKSQEFSDWFFNDAKQSVRDTFAAWDDGTKLDGVAMARAFNEFKTVQAEKSVAKEVEDETKAEKLTRSVEGKKTSTKPPAKRHMSEDEAFSTRLKETG